MRALTDPTWRGRDCRLDKQRSIALFEIEANTGVKCEFLYQIQLRSSDPKKIAAIDIDREQIVRMDGDCRLTTIQLSDEAMGVIAQMYLLLMSERIGNGTLSLHP